MVLHPSDQLIWSQRLNFLSESPPLLLREKIRGIFARFKEGGGCCLLYTCCTSFCQIPKRPQLIRAKVGPAVLLLLLLLHQLVARGGVAGCDGVRARSSTRLGFFLEFSFWGKSKRPQQRRDRRACVTQAFESEPDIIDKAKKCWHTSSTVINTYFPESIPE